MKNTNDCSNLAAIQQQTKNELLQMFAASDILVPYITGTSICFACLPQVKKYNSVLLAEMLY